MKIFGTFKEFTTFLETKLYLSKEGIYEIQKDIGTYEHGIYFDNKSTYLYEEYVTGGRSGGSCYGTESYDIESDSPEYKDFYQLCLLLFDTDSEAYDELENIKNNFLIEIDSDGYSDYYGNYTNKRFVILDLEYYYKKSVSLKEIRKEKLNKIFYDK